MLTEENQHLVVSAPGKVILHGEHAVVHGKRALACSLDLRTYLHVTPCKDGLVRINLPDISIYHEWNLLTIKSQLLGNNNASGDCKARTPSTEELKMISEFCSIDENTSNTKELAVIAFLYLYKTILKPDQMLAYDFMVSSNLPTSAGLGSSAAFGVSLVASLLTLSGEISSPRKDAFNTWSDTEQKLINEWAFIAEKIIHGNPSGVDNSVSTFGGIIKYQNKTLDKIHIKHELNVLITNTKIPRSTKQLVAEVARKLKRYPSIIEPVLDAIEAISSRCQQELTQESEPNYDTLQTMIRDNNSLLSVLGVNHPSLEKICRVTSDLNLHSKLTGAGGGGCAFTLLPPGTSEDLINQAIKELSTHGFECWNTIVGGAGVGLHTEEHAQFNIPTALKERAGLCNIL